MDLVSHQCSQALVYQLMPGKRALVVKLVADYERLKMGVVIAHDADICLWQSGRYQLRYFYWVHGSKFLEVSTRREV